MLTTLALVLLYQAGAVDQTTLPRHPDPDNAEQRDKTEGTPTDPWYKGDLVATDDSAFVLNAVESTRQAAKESETALVRVQRPQLREAARRIREQDDATLQKLESVAKQRGWRLPEPNPARSSMIEKGDESPTRADANYILNEIRYHQNTVAHYRAQIAGKGDPKLKRVLREALPGYERNLDMLLTLKF